MVENTKLLLKENNMTLLNALHGIITGVACFLIAYFLFLVVVGIFPTEDVNDVNEWKPLKSLNNITKNTIAVIDVQLDESLLFREAELNKMGIFPVNENEDPYYILYMRFLYDGNETIPITEGDYTLEKYMNVQKYNPNYVEIKYKYLSLSDFDIIPF